MAIAQGYNKLWTLWKGSLAIFKPENLKLFLLVTLNSSRVALKTVVTYFWPLLLFFVMLDLLYIQQLHYFIYKNVIQGIIQVVLLFIFALAIRPSVYIKNYKYFLSYIPYFPFFMLLANGKTIIAFMQCDVLLNIVTLCRLFGLFFVPLLILFFYNDTDGGIKSMAKSCLNGVKMTFYNYPFWLVTFLSITFISIIFSALFFVMTLSWTSSKLFFISTVLLIRLFTAAGFIFIISWCNNFYLKKIHEQSDLYNGDMQR